MTDHHRHDRRRVVGVVLAGCVLIGGLGAVAGEAFDPEPVRGGRVVQPTVAPHVAGLGRSVAFGSHAVDVTGPGSVVTLQDGVAVFVPPGWEVSGQRETNVSLANGQGSFAYALTGRANPGSSASGLLAANLPEWLPPETYTQQVLVDYGELDPFGTVVSAAYAEYDAVLADNQGALPIHGQLYVGLRDDDVALLVLVEHTPSREWDTVGVPAVKDVVNNSFSLFAEPG